MSDNDPSAEQTPSSEGPAPLPAAPVNDRLVPSYFTPVPATLITLRTMPPLEAELARAKLESEGLPCVIADQTIAAAHPLLFNQVRLQVRACDREAAEEILSRPVPAGSDDDYAEEEWRCPRCHRKTIVLLPSSPAARCGRTAWLILLVLPLLVLAVQWAVPFRPLVKFLDEAMSWGTVPWMLMILPGGLLLLCLPRGKRCTDCGWSDARHDGE